MKKITAAFLFFSFIFLTSYGQEFKKLNLNVKTNLIKQSAIYVEPIDNDRLLLVTYFKESLEANGFKVVADRKDAAYVISIKYQYRHDTGCGGSVIEDMNGAIIDLKNNAETVADFSFRQGVLGGKCASDIMSALAKKLNEKAL